MTKKVAWVIDKPENCIECPIPSHATVNRTEYLISGCFQYSRCPLVPFDIQPTVEAIPIEWIREYCKYNHTPDGMDWHIAVDLIIKRWEKENEIN